MMKTSVSWLVLGFVTASACIAGACVACAPSPPPPPPEVPAQPLVIGTSPAPAPIRVAPTPDEPVQDAPIATSSPLAIPARDPRLTRPVRARALLVTELTALEQLFGATPVGAPDRPTLARRLAETYTELSRTADPAVATNARQSALKYYDLIVTETPTYPQIDEVHYFAGLGRELAGDNRGARTAYYQLIQHAPNSKYVPFAYFAFGELFLREAESDPSKNELAQQAYNEVIKYPPPGNALFAEAKQRLAEISVRRKDGAKVRRP